MMNATKALLRKLTKHLKVISLALLLLTAKSVYAQKTEPIEKGDKCEEIFDVVEKQPEFDGGIEGVMRFLSENTVYPEEAANKGIEGKVITNFIVHKDGSTSDINILKGVDSLLDAEAMRVLSLMPKWEAGMLNGEAVNVRFTLPVTFKLRNDEELDNKAIEDEKEGKLDPEYLQFLSDNARYPEIALQRGIDGIIRATFDVNSEGKISNIQITDGRDKSLKNEVVRLIKKIPAHLALARTGDKESKDVDISVTFRIQHERPVNGSSKYPVTTDIIVIAVRSS